MWRTPGPSPPDPASTPVDDRRYACFNAQPSARFSRLVLRSATQRAADAMKDGRRRDGHCWNARRTGRPPRADGRGDTSATPAAERPPAGAAELAALGRARHLRRRSRRGGRRLVVLPQARRQHHHGHHRGRRARTYEKERPGPSRTTRRTSCSSARTPAPARATASTAATTAAASAPTPRSCCTSPRTGRARRRCPSRAISWSTSPAAASPTAPARGSSSRSSTGPSSSAARPAPSVPSRVHRHPHRSPHGGRLPGLQGHGRRGARRRGLPQGADRRHRRASRLRAGQAEARTASRPSVSYGPASPSATAATPNVWNASSSSSARWSRRCRATAYCSIRSGSTRCSTRRPSR